MMIKTSFIFLPSMLLLVLLFMVASSDAFPTSGSRVMFKDDQQVVLHESHLQDVIGNGDDNDKMLKAEGVVERRVDIETTDYPGTGANNHHDPKTPGGF